MSRIDYGPIGEALMNPLQRRILEFVAMREEPLSPNALHYALDVPLGNVSYHVKILAGHKSGKFAKQPLLKLVGTEPRRGAVEHFYALAEK